MLLAFCHTVANIMFLDQLQLNIFSSSNLFPSSAYKKTFQTGIKKSTPLYFNGQGKFPIISAFFQPHGTRVWQHYNVRARNNDECFASGVSNMVFSVNNGDIRHTYCWSKMLLRK